MAKEMARKETPRRGMMTDPFRDMMGLRDTITGLFDDFFSGRPMLGGMSQATETESEVWTPAVDIRESETEVVVIVGLPGVPKDGCSIEVRENTLVVSGRREAQTPEGQDFLRRELPTGQFYRAFALPTDVKAEQVKATCADGLLEIRLPKSEESRSRRIDIQ
jgi:HSP20 family protein